MNQKREEARKRFLARAKAAGTPGSGLLAAGPLELVERVLFLDIDGVLNSHAWLEQGHMKSHTKMETHFDPEACRLLNTVIQRTGCELVLSSSWRIGHDVSWIETVLQKRGCPLAKFRGETPNLILEDNSNDDLRGREIEAWLKAADFKDAFVIVDDSNDMGRLLPRLVRTSWRTGLTAEAVEDIVEMFDNWEG